MTKQPKGKGPTAKQRNQKQNLGQEPYTITHRTVGSICQVLQWNSRQSCLSAVVGSVSRRRSVSGDFSPPPPLRLDVRDPAAGQVSQSSSKLVFYTQSTGSVRECYFVVVVVGLEHVSCPTLKLDV